MVIDNQLKELCPRIVDDPHLPPFTVKERICIASVALLASAIDEKGAATLFHQRTERCSLDDFAAIFHGLAVRARKPGDVKTADTLVEAIKFRITKGQEFRKNTILMIRVHSAILWMRKRETGITPVINKRSNRSVRSTLSDIGLAPVMPEPPVSLGLQQLNFFRLFR